MLDLNFSFFGQGFVGLNVRWKGIVYNFVNIYAPCNGGARRLLWRNLVNTKMKYANEEWCLGGDFSEVCGRKERMGVGSYFNRSDMYEFKRFINDMGITVVSCVGGKFTWYNSNEKAMSRLDRFLLSRKLIDIWEVVDRRIGSIDISNHSPIWLQKGKVDWGPKPFRFNNVWLRHEGFEEFVKVKWAKMEVVGRGIMCYTRNSRV